MSENVGQFRGAAFGSFHRQDVLDYLERITQEHQEKTQTLIQALEEERTARRQDQAAREALEQELSTQTAAQQKLEEEQKETRRALEEARIALAAAEARAEALSGRVDELAPEAASWQRIRDTAGDIEVSAHERAQITVEAARIQAAEIRAEETDHGHLPCRRRTGAGRGTPFFRGGPGGHRRRPGGPGPSGLRAGGERPLTTPRPPKKNPRKEKHHGEDLR